MLTMDVEVILGDFVGQQHGVFAAFCRTGVARALQDTAIDHEMGDVDILRLQFARERLCQAAQAEFAHREGG